MSALYLPPSPITREAAVRSAGALTEPDTDLAPRIEALLASMAQPLDLAAALRALVDARLDRLPLPGSGRTLDRWRALARVARHDLALAKLYEGHTDALAILAELGASGPEGDVPGLWGVWCAEPPNARVVAHTTGAHADEVRGGEVNLQGTKAWCSGAGVVTHALISAWNTDRQPVLVAADLRQPSVSIDEDGWRAVGMGRSGSYSVVLDGSVAHGVGAPGDYVARPGFLQGGAGVAACWYGGLEGIAQALRRSLDQKAGRSASEAAAPPELAHALAHLGAVDVALTQARASLREAAHHIDSHPDRPAGPSAARARLAVEAAARDVLDRVPRALGAGPLCHDRALAQALADLPVFIRQSHAERDLAAHAWQLLKGPAKEDPSCGTEDRSWNL
ncbi:acyl-CoA dehydrogenase [Comamonadaceae bacterium PP-2]